MQDANSNNMNMIILGSHFFSDTDLNDHLRSDDHLELISVINRSVPTIIKNLQLVPCDICNRKFRLNLALKKHMKSVHGLTGYQLKGHQKYTCNYCEYWSYKQKSLQIHSFLGKILLNFNQVNLQAKMATPHSQPYP